MGYLNIATWALVIAELLSPLTLRLGSNIFCREVLLVFMEVIRDGVDTKTRGSSLEIEIHSTAGVPLGMRTISHELDLFPISTSPAIGSWR